MLGAIIGDLAGSIYEYDQFYKVTTIKDIKNIIPKGAFFSDDTILTIAVADAILSNSDYGKKLKEYGKKYMNAIPKNLPYFKNMFSQGFTNWLEGDFIGESKGNGAMMRVSPVGYLFDNEKDVITNAKLATMPSHNTQEAIGCATMIALIIFYARQGLSKDEIKDKLDINIKKPEIKTFNYTCLNTIDLCLYSLFKGNSFEECLRIALSFGGDTDTNACIVGSMAEAFYGINSNLKNTALSLIPKEFVEIINRCEEKHKEI